jgi:hypothetical protein
MDLCIHYRTSAFTINGSQFNLAYDDIEISSLKYNGQEILSYEQVTSQNSIENIEYYYMQNGNQVSFYKKSTNKLVSLNGRIEIEATRVSTESDSSDNASSENQATRIIIDQPVKTLVERNGESDVNDFSNYNIHGTSS